MKICIIYGGTSRERDVSILSAKSILNVFSDEKDIFGYDFDGNYNDLLKNIKDVDLVFNALHGGDGENGVIQKFFENNSINFTGSGSKSSKKAMDKHLTKKICYKNEILTPDWFYYEKTIRVFQLERELLRFYDKDIVIKPSDEGSSLGLSIIKKFSPDNSKKREELDSCISQCNKVSKNIIIEEYIKGREITVGILGDKVFPILEIQPVNKFYDYECKYTKGKSKYIVPAVNIDKKLENNIAKIATKVYDLLNCRHYARVDFRLSKDNNLYLLEVNTLPGFTDTSLFPMAAKSIGINYKDLLLEIIKMSKK